MEKGKFAFILALLMSMMGTRGFAQSIEVVNSVQNNYDSQLDFTYVVEQGLYSDYCNKTLVKNSWNYPAELLTQLKSVSSNMATDYDYSYDSNSFDFVDGRYRSTEDSLLVRISPNGTDLTNADFTLLNGNGDDLVGQGLIEVAGVSKYDGGEGLWVVKFKMCGPLDCNGKYAVAVKNAETALSSGNVLSMTAVKAKHAYDFAVNGMSINEIHNRYVSTGESPNGSTTWTDDANNFPQSFAYELTWRPKDCGGNDAYSSIIFNDNVCDRYGHESQQQQGREWSGTDNRHGKSNLQCYFSAGQAPEGETGEWTKIEIEFPQSNYMGEPTPIRGFFVTLDQHFSVETYGSELSAWTTYIYKNVAKYPCDYRGGKTTDQDMLVRFEERITLQEGNKGVIYIKKANNIVGDVIGFRVHAVNFDGTLTDPDGRAFYVEVAEEGDLPGGGSGSDPQDYEITYLWNKNNPAIRGAGNSTEAFVPVVGTEADVTSLATDVVIYGMESFRVDDIFSFDETDQCFHIKPECYNRLIDGETYRFTKVVKRKNSFSIINTIDIEVTKEMPTDLPESFGVRTLQNVNGISVYLRPNAEQDMWKIAGNESNRWGVDARPYCLEDILNGMFVFDDYSGKPVIDKNYFFEIANSGENGSAVVFGYDDSFTSYSAYEGVRYGGYPLPKIHWSSVNDGELHEMKAGYIYRNISATLQADGKAFLPPSGSERYGGTSGIANQDYRLDAIPFDSNGRLAGQSLFKLRFSCALDAAVKMTVDDTEREYDHNQDVYMSLADVKFKLTSISWAEGDRQPYLNAQLPIKTMNEELTLPDMLSQSYLQLDVSSLRVSATDFAGLDVSRYFSPFFSVGETAFNPEKYSITQINGIKMNATVSMDYYKSAECKLSFDVYDIWQHKKTVSIPFTIIGKTGDMDGNGVLDGNDVMAILAIVLSGSSGNKVDPAADYNGDGVVDITDVTALIKFVTQSSGRADK